MTSPLVSVTFCSRGRPESCGRTLRSLFGSADVPARVEAIIAVDPDEDIEAYTLALPAGARLWIAPERYGYTRLHDYLNPLAAMAAGRWCFWLNDDMTVLTPGWDTVVLAQEPGVLWPRANHVIHANIAPAWPRSWSDALGYASPTSHMDTYLQRLGEAVGRHVPVPIEILHDRADVTGNHDDQTYAEGRARLGPEGMVPGFDATQFHAQVEADATVIRGLFL
jgi:hypothetical protein